MLSIVLLIAYLKTGGSTAGKTGSHTVETTHYSTIPGLDLGGLGASEQRQLVSHLNQTPCICDCEMTVAECRHIDPKCDHSLERARAYLDALTAKVSGVSDLPIVPTH